MAFSQVAERINALTQIQTHRLSLGSLGDEEFSMLEQGENAPHLGVGHMVQLADLDGLFQPPSPCRLARDTQSSTADSHEDTGENLKTNS